MTKAESRLIPRSKLDDQTVRRIVRGFVLLESVDEIAAASGVSAKTARKFILALRPMLLTEPFDAWREAGTERTILDAQLDETARTVVFGCFAACYFNRACFTNHQQGRRASRRCRACPIMALELPPDFVAAALYQIDLVHSVYAILGIGGERGPDQTMIFRLRLAHTQIIGEAQEASGWDDDGGLNIESHDRLSVQALEGMIIRNIDEIAL